ncbi:alpha/beta hydrolase [Luteolibacter marinus]|uniref:alpha/beta hydrolase n=1 Tax=Luteolibacter marinus TaxID=2776705 RepID=UPI001866C9EC
MNSKGPNELRMLEVNKAGRGWSVKVIPDKLEGTYAKETETLKKKYKLGHCVLDEFCEYTSEYVALKTFDSIRKNKRNFLLFVHGFNNDLKAVLDRAHQLEQDYQVEVIPFSWPANGGGVRGVVSYKSDKRDARTSIGALDRVLEILWRYLDALNEKNRQAVEKAIEDSKQLQMNKEERDEFIARTMEMACPVSVNVLFHSMGNYLFKNLLLSPIFHARATLFDNVVMAAADVNNEGHAEWVEKIQARNRIYITINEDDYALRAARIKSGEEQVARLGHYPYNLTAKNAVYVNFSNAKGVGESHSYFESKVITTNVRAGRFFKLALQGRVAEKGLKYDPSQGYYQV